MEAKSKKDTLKARAASAKTSKQVQEMLGSLNTSNAVVAFEKMEEKVMAMEAEADSVQQLVRCAALRPQRPPARSARFRCLVLGVVLAPVAYCLRLTACPRACWPAGLLLLPRACRRAAARTG
jgi:hypothetical protein